MFNLTPLAKAKQQAAERVGLFVICPTCPTPQLASVQQNGRHLDIICSKCNSVLYEGDHGK